MGEQVEAGRLAGAIGSDQCMDRPTPHREVDAVDGDKALELLGEALGRQYRVVSHLFLGREHPAPGGLSGLQRTWQCACAGTPFSRPIPSQHVRLAETSLSGVADIAPFNTRGARNTSF